MTVTRRAFAQTAGLGAAAALSRAWIGARGREHALGSLLEPPLQAIDRDVIVLASNENPRGPSDAVIQAVRRTLDDGGRAAGRYSTSSRDLVEAIAGAHRITPENVVLGCGSTQLLRSATHLFTDGNKPLVATTPTYEECAGYAGMMDRPVRTAPLDSSLTTDLDRLAAASTGAGLVFYCNPNNPTATYVGARASREFFARVFRDSPDTTILVDEAYFDYVTATDHETHIPVAVDHPRLIVTRTFSKVHGMAGLRLGYAVGHRETIKKMADWDGGSGTGSLNVLAIQAGIAALAQEPSVVAAERARNAEVRAFTMDWFTQRGMKPAASQANFLFVDIGRPAKAFREACRATDVLVGRDFPPFARSHCRISFGTMAEMKRAVGVFDKVLGRRSAAA